MDVTGEHCARFSKHGGHHAAHADLRSGASRHRDHIHAAASHLTCSPSVSPPPRNAPRPKGCIVGRLQLPQSPPALEANGIADKHRTVYSPTRTPTRLCRRALAASVSPVCMLHVENVEVCLPCLCLCLQYSYFMLRAQSTGYLGMRNALLTRPVILFSKPN